MLVIEETKSFLTMCCLCCGSRPIKIIPVQIETTRILARGVVYFSLYILACDKKKIVDNYRNDQLFLRSDGNKAKTLARWDQTHAPKIQQSTKLEKHNEVGEKKARRKKKGTGLKQVYLPILASDR